MNLHEFQAKELLARFGIPIPAGRLVASAAAAERVAQKLGCRRYVVKAQVHAGDRRANGGIVSASTPAEVRIAADRLLGRPLVTSQTAPTGQLVRWVYVEEAVDIEQQLYLAATVDPRLGRLLLLVSRDGGDDIEARAASGPHVIERFAVSVSRPADPALFADAAASLGLDGPLAVALGEILSAMVQMAIDLDASLVEINPLAVSRDGRLIALDAKMQIDENALFRQPDLAALREVEAAETGDPLELAAQQHQINYLRMDGEIGVVVNGAGLALATLDTLADCGGRPANFMDIRTTATSQDIAYGFRLILSNLETQVVLVNVHGGGMQRCDTIAEGIAMAVRGSNRVLPMIVRLAGNNAEFARTRLAASGVAFEEAHDMRSAAERAVALCGREAA